MYRKNVYGKSRDNLCPFCSKNAVTSNEQGVPVCVEHRKTNLHNMKCVCGEWLDLRSGKWGPYFSCMRCGNINFNKGLEMNNK